MVSSFARLWADDAGRRLLMPRMPLSSFERLAVDPRFSCTGLYSKGGQINKTSYKWNNLIEILILWYIWRLNSGSSQLFLWVIKGIHEVRGINVINISLRWSGYILVIKWNVNTLSSVYMQRARFVISGTFVERPHGDNVYIIWNEDLQIFIVCHGKRGS